MDLIVKVVVPDITGEMQLKIQGYECHTDVPIVQVANVAFATEEKEGLFAVLSKKGFSGFMFFIWGYFKRGTSVFPVPKGNVVLWAHAPAHSLNETVFQQCHLPK